MPVSKIKVNGVLVDIQDKELTQQVGVLFQQVASNTQAIQAIAASGGASLAEAVIFPDGENLAVKMQKKTEKVRVDITGATGNYQFELNGVALDFATLNYMLQESPDFIVFVHENREHRCVEILEGNPKSMTFLAPTIEGTNVKAQSFKVVSTDGTSISSIKRTDIICENKTDTDALRENVRRLIDNEDSTPIIINGVTKQGSLAVNNNLLVIGSALDAIAFDGKTYRDIFERGNMLGITPSFSSGNFSPMIVNAGEPSVEIDVYNEKNALKCYGATSQQLKTPTALRDTIKYAACVVNCSRYTSGRIGVPISYCDATLSRTTEGWEFVSAIESETIHYGINGYIGSASSADLDGYVAFPICLDLSMFDEVPTKMQLDSLYNQYVELAIVESGGLPLIVKGEVKHEQSESISAFVGKMNEYAKDFGMLNTHFVNASGMHHSNHYSTASDIVRLCAACTQYEKLMRYWGLLNYNVSVGGTHARTISGVSTYKGEVMRSVGDHYHIFGGKSGSWTTDDFQNKNLTLAVKSKIDDTWLIGCVMRSEVDDRGIPFKQLLDWLEDYRTNPSAPMPTIDATYAAAAALPPVSAMAYADVDIIDVNKSGNTQFLPASMTKLMTALVVLDYCDLSETITIEQSDIQSGSGDTFYAGDTLSVRDAIIAMLLPSSNTLATAFSRFVGNKIINQKLLITHQV